jgi:hypothetical protein
MKLKGLLFTTRTLCLLGGVASLTLAVPVNAATMFTDPNPPVDSLIQTAGNWDTGLPTSSNLGTINIDARYISGTTGLMTGYFMTQTGGIMTQIGNATFNLTNGSYGLNGGSAEFNYAGLGLTSTTFIVDTGTGIGRPVATARGTSLTTGSTLTINGGSMTFNREFNVNDTSQLIVNGGSLTIGAGATVAQTGFKADAAGAGNVGFIFNGGTTTAPDFSLAASRTARFGGSSEGTVSLANLGTNITLDWLANSLMTLSITGANQTFYEALWTSTTLKYNGGNMGAFSDNFQVSGTTLSLIPEPSAALLSALGVLGLLRRRR